MTSQAQCAEQKIETNCPTSVGRPLDVRCDPRARWTEDLYENLPPGDRRLIVNNSYGARQPYGRFAH